MQEKLLYNLIEEIAGEGNGRIIDTLYNKKDVNEFLIAKKMELTINQVRNILYKLSNYGLVSFVRKKDKRKGWYIYYWTIDNGKCLELIEDHLKKRVHELETQLHDRETKRYYTCPYCKIEVSEDIALENGFTCEECAEVYGLTDNIPYIRDTKSKITRISNEIDEINKELDEYRSKEKKKIDKQNKKEEKEKEEKKIEKRKIASDKRIANKEAIKKANENNPIKKTPNKVSKNNVKKDSVKNIKTKKNIKKKSTKNNAKK
jgi:transcription factor E